MIGSDILDIGSSKWNRENKINMSLGESIGANMTATPDQFMLPNVTNVSISIRFNIN
jgi:hypothetical protein